jgi:hypothetical protein
MSKTKSKHIMVERKLIASEVFRSLSKTATTVYLDFLCRRVFVTPRGKPGKRKYILVNNGKIEFTYSEALKKKITKPAFARAITMLVEKGFIDITHSGGVFDGDKSLYALSNRWEKHGTSEFKKQTRPKDERKDRGFSKMHSKEKQKDGRILTKENNNNEGFLSSMKIIPTPGINTSWGPRKTPGVRSKS